jgi:hypothetical protein
MIQSYILQIFNQAGKMTGIQLFVSQMKAGWAEMESID